MILTRSGIGKVAASVATSLLLENSPRLRHQHQLRRRFRPGSAIGDVVIASEMRFHDVDVTAFGYEMGQMAQQPAAFPCDDKLIALAQTCIAEQGRSTRPRSASSVPVTSSCASPRRLRKPAPTSRRCWQSRWKGPPSARCATCSRCPTWWCAPCPTSPAKRQVESFDAFIEVAGQHSAEVIIALLGKL